MILKRPLDPHRLRTRPPRGFGWLDHRLLRDGYFLRCSPQAVALYALLVCAGDGQGLSFYGETRLQQMLGVDLTALREARRALLAAALIAYREPLYQVLALPFRSAVSAPLPKAASAPAPVLRPKARPEPPPAAAPRGLDLRAMVQCAMQTGGGR